MNLTAARGTLLHTIICLFALVVRRLHLRAYSLHEQTGIVDIGRSHAARLARLRAHVTCVTDHLLRN